MEPQVQDFNSRGREVSMMLVGMLQKLEELEHAGARSVALEMESMVEEQRSSSAVSSRNCEMRLWASLDG